MKLIFPIDLPKKIKIFGSQILQRFSHCNEVSADRQDQSHSQAFIVFLPIQLSIISNRAICSIVFSLFLQRKLLSLPTTTHSVYICAYREQKKKKKNCSRMHLFISLFFRRSSYKTITTKKKKNFHSTFFRAYNITTIVISRTIFLVNTRAQLFFIAVNITTKKKNLYWTYFYIVHVISFSFNFFLFSCTFANFIHLTRQFKILFNWCSVNL